MDHNGWLSDADSGGPGEASGLSQGVYFGGCYDTSFTNSIFTRSSSINTKFQGSEGQENACPNITVDNNFYMGGEIGIQIGSNYSSEGNYRFKDLEITNCVIQDAGWENPQGRTLAGVCMLKG